MTHATGFHDPDAGRDVARFVGLTLREVPASEGEGAHVVGTAPVHDHIRDAGGAVHTGVVLTMADSVAGLCAGLAALPGWVVSTNLLLRTSTHHHVGPFELDATTLRAGRNAVVTRVDVRDAGAAGRVVADGILTSSVLQPAGGPPVYDRPLVLEAPEPKGPLPPAWDFFALVPRDEHTMEMALEDRLRNPWGILHGGALAMLADAAAAHVSGRSDARAADVVLHFLRPARVGPVTGRAEILGIRPDGTLTHVALHDEGADDRLVATAIVTVRGDT